ncbi:MAG: hypothetical protein OXG03_07385 [Gammaproteobacteria bacterium]|nr:hypothetical protein [Gammaproteobacteria bacterium]
MVKEIYLVEFDDGDDTFYIAYGEIKTNMPVFQLLSDDRHSALEHVAISARYPSMLKFINPKRQTIPVKATRKSIAERFGDKVGRSTRRQITPPRAFSP